ncbi:MAG: hypothetical protein AB7O24_00185 [Kofleriaceae bacterium]
MKTREVRMTRVRWEEEFCQGAVRRSWGHDRKTVTEPQWVAEFAPPDQEPAIGMEAEWPPDPQADTRPYFVVAFLADEDDRRTEELLDAVPLIARPEIAFRRAG